MNNIAILNGSVNDRNTSLYVTDGKFCVDGLDIAKAMDYPKDSFFKDTATLLKAEILEDFLSSGRKLLESGILNIDISKVRFNSPISETSKILCAGFNYSKHNAENKLPNPSMPYFFQRLYTTVVGPYEDIPKPKDTTKMDYEIELAIMISKKGKDIPVSEAMEYIAGYFVANDVSLRDYQFNEYNLDLMKIFGQNWLYGKNMDKTFPSGPFLVPRSSCDRKTFELETKINGEIVQDASTSEMIFKIPELIHYASKGITLLPGDVISTGTPEGTARGGGHAYLAQGDIVEGTVKGIGTIKNRVVINS